MSLSCTHLDTRRHKSCIFLLEEREKFVVNLLIISVTSMDKCGDYNVNGCIVMFVTLAYRNVMV